MRYRRPNIPDRSGDSFPRSEGDLAHEHQRLVAELRASEDRWRALVEGAPIGIAVHQDNCLVFANPEALRIIGAKDASEILGRQVFDFVSPDRRQRFVRRLAEVRAGRATARLHERLVRLDGSLIDVEISGVPTVLDGRPAGQIVLRDMTDEIRRQEEQARLTQVLETTTDLVLIVGEGPTLVYMNRAARRVLDIDVDVELTGDLLQRLYPAWVVRLLRDVALPAVQRTGRWKGETAILDARGREIPVSHLMVAHHDTAGRFQHVSNIMRDIREQKEVEAMLRTLNAISFGMADAPDARTALIVATRHARQATGWPMGVVWLPERGSDVMHCAFVEREDTPELAVFEDVCRSALQHPDSMMLGPIDADHIRPRDLATLTPSHRRNAALHAGLRYGLSVPIVVDGQLIAVVEAFMRQLRESDDRHVAAIAYASVQLGVIVRRKQVEDALQWHDTLLRAVTAAAPGGLLVVDSNTSEILFVNQRFIDIWGLQECTAAMRTGSITGRDLAGIVAPQLVDPAAFEAAFIPMRDPDARLTIEDELQLADGRVMRRFTTQIRDAGDRCLGRLYLVEDITERTRLERQLGQAQKMEAVGRLAGGIAHDFNNLLTAIRSYSEFLLEDIPETDPRHADVLEIKKASDRATSLTRQLLLFSRQQPVQPAAVSLNDTVTEIERMLRRLIGEDIEFHTSLDPSAGTVMVDAGQLEQAIVNLVVNARDAMPAGGRLIIETKRRRLAMQRDGVMGPLVPGEYAMLTVRDTGIGIDAATRARIFDPFFTTKEMGRGSGLGLATVYGIMQRFGGNIEVVSAPNAGASFSLAFPVRPSEPPPRLATPAFESSIGRERVLLVEDEDTVRRLARRALESKGYAVVDAASAQEALAIMERDEGRFDLLLTDVIMPGMSGRELAERLRARWSRLRVLFTSGYTANELPENLDLDAGFIPKPFTPESLTRGVRERLDRPLA